MRQKGWGPKPAIEGAIADLASMQGVRIVMGSFMTSKMFFPSEGLAATGLPAVKLALVHYVPIGNANSNSPYHVGFKT